MQKAILGLLWEFLLMWPLRAALKIGLAAKVKVPLYFEAALPRLWLVLIVSTILFSE